MSIKVTTQDFINKAKKVHGSRYRYDKVNYVKAIKKVTITCPKHGDFEQQPSNHLTGYGCRKCGGNQPITFNEFVERSKEIHGDKYDYSSVCFDNVESKIDIRCKEHGVFSQRLFSHLKGFGCPTCGNTQRGISNAHDKKEFIKRSREIHGDKYDYSKVEYKNANPKVTIICPIHGEFSIRPINLTKGVRCSKCSDEEAGLKRRISPDEFIKRAKLIHGEKYDYSKCSYKTMHEKVEVICPEHGSFYTLPPNHVRGQIKSGCPDCPEGKGGFRPKSPGILYYVSVLTDNNETLYKIGITNHTIKKRFSIVDRSRMRVIKIWRYEIGEEAFELERRIKAKFKSYKYNGPGILESGGDTELFTKDILDLDKLDYRRMFNFGYSEEITYEFLKEQFGNKAPI